MDNGTTTPCSWTRNPDGSLTLAFPPAATVVPTTGTPHVPLDLNLNAYYWLHGGTLTGALTLRKTDGALLGTAPQTFQIEQSWPPDDLTWDVLGRDKTGVLWRYHGTGQATSLFGGREKIGTGWGQYTAVVSLAGQRGDGTGDLVARDASGVLWYYQGSGNSATPLKSRMRIGSGWNEYSYLIGAGDLTGDGKPDLLARDASGVLWLYQGTGSATAPFKARTRIGSGWNQFTVLTGSADLTGDGKPDLLARDASGVLWLYQGTGNPVAPFKSRVRIDPAGTSSTPWSHQATSPTTANPICSPATPPASCGSTKAPAPLPPLSSPASASDPAGTNTTPYPDLSRSRLGTGHPGQGRCLSPRRSGPAAFVGVAHGR